jgi:hypothetical protein
MAEDKPDDGTVSYAAREAVGVFDKAEGLEAAVDQLEMSGFDRAEISVLASDKTVRDRLGRLYGSVAEIVDDPRAPRAAFVSKDSRVEGQTAVIGAPLFIGGIAGGLDRARRGGSGRGRPARARDRATPYRPCLGAIGARRSGALG